jgi:hypothetical protein
MLEPVILDVLDKTSYANCAYVKKEVSSKVGKSIHFNTVKKYLESLAENNLIFKKTLPVTKLQHKKGTTLYSKKPFPANW